MSLPPIIFCQIGKVVPPYLQDAMEQARLFNQTANIVLLTDAAISEEEEKRYDRITLQVIHPREIPQGQKPGYLPWMEMKFLTQTG